MIQTIPPKLEDLVEATVPPRSSVLYERELSAVLDDSLSALIALDSEQLESLGKRAGALSILLLPELDGCEEQRGENSPTHSVQRVTEFQVKLRVFADVLSSTGEMISVLERVSLPEGRCCELRNR